MYEISVSYYNVWYDGQEKRQKRLMKSVCRDAVLSITNTYQKFNPTYNRNKLDGIGSASGKKLRIQHSPNKIHFKRQDRTFSENRMRLLASLLNKTIKIYACHHNFRVYTKLKKIVTRGRGITPG